MTIWYGHARIGERAAAQQGTDRTQVDHTVRELKILGDPACTVQSPPVKLPIIK